MHGTSLGMRHPAQQELGVSRQLISAKVDCDCDVELLLVKMDENHGVLPLKGMGSLLCLLEAGPLKPFV